MSSKAYILVACFLMLNGCTEGAIATWEPESPSERELRESREALQRTVGEGSLFGAAAGAAVGVAAGGIQGGFQGARVGQLAGATAGNYVKSLQIKYATQEQQLLALQQDIQKTNANMERSLKAMKASLEAQKSQVQVDQTRSVRVADEAEATVRTSERYRNLFLETRSILSTQGYRVSELDDDLSALSTRVEAMRVIAEDLATNL